MFWIRYKDRNGLDVERSLNPAPSTVEYPDKRNHKTHVTQDGAVVIQRPLRDARPRKWKWHGYRPTIAAYEDQWKILEGLDYRTRLEQGLPPTVEVWEDVSGVGGFARLDGNGKRVYTRVRFTQVDRTPRNGGGPVVYGESVIEFYVDDPSYRAF